MKQTLKEANYTFLYKEGHSYFLLNNDSGNIEVFYKSKNFNGWGLIYKNTHLEFGYSQIKER